MDKALTDLSVGTGTAALRFESVAFERGGEALLHDVNFALSEDPLSVVLGHNGAGKSLLLRLAHGLIRPDRGRVTCHGQAPARAARRQALVFQRPVMLRRTVLANVMYPLKLRRWASAVRRQRAIEMLERVGLLSLAKRPARVLSGGEQQRLALARAWATRPELMLLDEPTANLDPAGTKAVEDIVQAIKQEGTKIVLTTHDMGQARRLADEVLFLHQGRLIEVTHASSFFNQPRSREAQAYVEGRLLW